MRKIFLAGLLIISVILSVAGPVLATSGTPQVIVLSDKISYQQGDKVEVTINLNDFTNLYSVLLEYKAPAGILAPIRINDAFFDDNNGFQIFSPEDRAQALKAQTGDGTLVYFVIDTANLQGYSSTPDIYRNRLVRMNFTALVAIADIRQYFQPSDIYSVTNAMYLKLEDVNRQTISYAFNHFEKVKVNWNAEYQLHVGEPFPNMTLFQNDMDIMNRTPEQVVVVFNSENINVNQIGPQGLAVIITDTVSRDVLFLFKEISIVDDVPPEIHGEKVVTLPDTAVAAADFLEGITVTDNYSNNMIPLITYLEENQTTVIPSGDGFRAYLLSHLKGYVKVNVSDSSSNQASAFLREIRITDITAPVISHVDDIILEDDEAQSCQFEDLVTISDAYDPDPMLVFSFFDIDGEPVDDYRFLLAEGKSAKIRYFALDDAFNRSDELETVVEVRDTMKPTISVPSETPINDSDITTFDPAADASVADNFALCNPILISYFGEDQSTAFDFQQFLTSLSQGHACFIRYEITDNGGNVSDPVYRKMLPVDTTKPEIEVTNILPGAQYLPLDNIDFSVSDNFDGEVEITITLDGEAYLQEKIAGLGKHTLIIRAKDQTGNEAELKMEFEIIAKKIFACGDDIRCYVTNYYEYLIGGSIIIIIIIYSIVYFVNRKKGEKEKPTIY